MATARLSKRLVEETEPGASDSYLWDAALPRFGVRVTPSGSRIYLIQYRARAHGAAVKTRRITIGQHGQPWTVETARAEARKFLAAVDLGRDPFGEREADLQARAREQEARLADALLADARSKQSFASIADRYIALKQRKNRSWAETERLLKFGTSMPNQPERRGSGHRTDVELAAPGPVKAWGDRHISEIGRADVADLIDRISERSPAIARATFAALRPLFDWCVERELIEHSPCDKLRAPPRPTARDRVLSEEELATIWKAAEQLGHPFGPVVQLLILTGQRRGEVAGMRWDELDLKAQTWRIPAERTKNGNAHEVDLSPAAVSIIKRMPKLGPHVFPARGEGAVRGFSATKRRLDELVGDARPNAARPKPWRIHDLRRTAATGMAALGFAPHVIERVLNHTSGIQGGLVGVYQRHEYRPERKAAIDAWSEHVSSLVD